jgi:hypothetical protein
MYCSVDDLLFWEKKAFGWFRCYEREFGYNLGLDPTTTKHSEETRKKMSLAHVGKKSNLGRKWSPEIREKMSKASKGVPKSAEHRKKLSEAAIGKKLSDEHREKISQSLIGNKHASGCRGKIVSKETRKKISIATKKYWENKKNNLLKGDRHE